MAESADAKCFTCYGEGTVGSERGPVTCADCGGLGVLPSVLALTESRLRELERSYEQRGGEAQNDVRWLVTEVRRAHHALVQILAAGHDADDNDALAKKIRFIANDVLRMYPKYPL